MSARHPYMPLYIADYELDTKHLTPAEDGIYGRLLRALWIANGRLPADDRFLARTCRISLTVWRRVKNTVLAFFRIEDGLLSQKRVTKELEKAEGISRKRSKAAKTKAKRQTGITYHDSKNVPNIAANPLNDNDVAPANAVPARARSRVARARPASQGDSGLRESVDSSSSLRSEESCTPQAARTTRFDPADVHQEPKERTPTQPPPDFDLTSQDPDARIGTGKGAKQDEKGFRRALAYLCLDPELVDNIVTQRRVKRAVITPLAGRSLAKALASCGDAADAAILMIDKGWLGIKADWYQREQARYTPMNGSGRRKSMLDEHIEEMQEKYGDRSAIDVDLGEFAKHLISGQ